MYNLLVCKDKTFHRVEFLAYMPIYWATNIFWLLNTFFEFVSGEFEGIGYSYISIAYTYVLYIITAYLSFFFAVKFPQKVVPELIMDPRSLEKIISDEELWPQFKKHLQDYELEPEALFIEEYYMYSKMQRKIYENVLQLRRSFFHWKSDHTSEVLCGKYIQKDSIHTLDVSFELKTRLIVLNDVGRLFLEDFEKVREEVFDKIYKRAFEYFLIKIQV